MSDVELLIERVRSGEEPSSVLSSVEEATPQSGDYYKVGSGIGRLMQFHDKQGKTVGFTMKLVPEMKDKYIPASDLGPKVTVPGYKPTHGTVLDVLGKRKNPNKVSAVLKKAGIRHANINGFFLVDDMEDAESELENAGL